MLQPRNSRRVKHPAVMPRTREEQRGEQSLAASRKQARCERAEAGEAVHATRHLFIRLAT